jgi:hypothetical protein
MRYGSCFLKPSRQQDDRYPRIDGSIFPKLRTLPRTSYGAHTEIL